MAKNFPLLVSCTAGLTLNSDKASEITLHKGALIQKTTSGHNIYQHRGECRQAVQYHITTADVICKELDQRQFEFLSKISDDEIRYQVYAMGWGDNDVSVKRHGICIDVQDSDYEVDCAPSASNSSQSKKMSINKMSMDSNSEPKHKKRKIAAQRDSQYYIEKFEQERKHRMAAKEKIKQLQIENEYLESIWKKSREMDIEQKNEIAKLHQENDLLKQTLSDSQKVTDQLKSTVEDLTQYGEVYQKEMQDLQENIKQVKQDLDQVKEELDHSVAEKVQLEEQIQALEADKEQLSSQVQSLSPASRWKINYDELTITDTDNDLGKGAWAFVKKGSFYGTKVAVKGIHQAIISSVANEIIQREFHMMAQVRHPNLVLLIGAVFNDPRHKGPLIITELLDCSMRSAYEEGKLDRPCRLPLLRDVAAALNYLHSRKQPIIHRDISSANVMLEASGSGKWKRAKL